MSIKFGLTEKERILQLARAEGNDPCIPSTFQPTTELAVLQAAIKRGPEFFQAIPVALRPIAPFIRVRPKLPRAIRQKVLDKLTGQCLALEAVLINHTDTTKEDDILSPSSVATDVTAVKRSVAAAVEQEADMYEQCASVQVYQNLAARCSALVWRSEVRAATAAENAYEELLAMQKSEDKRVKDEGAGGKNEVQKKKRKIEIEDTNNVATINNKSQLEVERFTVAVGGIAPNAKQQALLVESDLDWNESKPDKSKNVQEIRRCVMHALENCPKWSLLTVDQRVDCVERCTLKVNRSSDGSNNIDSIDDTALQRLARQYIHFMIRKSKT